MFIDEARIYLEAGRGGDGAVAFRREKYVPRGGPAGGDGGKGGDIIFVVDSGLNTLEDLRHRTHYRAEPGTNGGNSNRSGAQGSDMEVRVPLGTMVLTEDGHLLADLTEPAQRLVVARGGRGGKGNARFASSTHRVPRIAERGQPGESFWVRIELTLLADVGLVGFPNAGKSTLISRMSQARPRIADYPFTTLVPNLGVVAEYGDPFVMADVPGLIEGAHTGAGLGHAFLKHLSRTRLLVHLLDLSPMTERDPVNDYRIIRHELEQFSPALAARPEIVVANKMDLAEAADRYGQLQDALGESVLGISAVTGRGIPELGRLLAERLQQLPPLAPDRPPAVVRPKPTGFQVTPEPDGALRLVGDLEERAEMTRWGSREAEDYLIEYLRRRGVRDALRRLGATAGQTVRVGPGEFRWWEDDLVREDEAEERAERPSTGSRVGQEK